MDSMQDHGTVLAGTLLSRHADCLSALDVPDRAVSCPCFRVVEDITSFFGTRLYSVRIGDRDLMNNMSSTDLSTQRSYQTSVNAITIVLDAHAKTWTPLVLQLVVVVFIYVVLGLAHRLLDKVLLYVPEGHITHLSESSVTAFTGQGGTPAGSGSVGLPQGPSRHLPDPYLQSQNSSTQDPTGQPSEREEANSRNSRNTGSDIRDMSSRISRVHGILDTVQNIQDKHQELKSFFLHAVSHELRTPIAVMMGNAEMILNMATSPDQIELLEDIQACGAQALQRVSDILDYGSFLERVMVTEAQSFSLTPFVESTVAAFRTKHIRNITLVIDAEVPEHVEGDAPKLARVIRSILDNSVKHTKESDDISVRIGLPSANVLSYLRDLSQSTPDVTSLQTEVLILPLRPTHQQELVSHA